MDAKSLGKLVRFPLPLTVIADLYAGTAPAQGGFGPGTAPAFIASLSIYSAGLIFNDLADLEKDRKLRPERPLVTGEATRKAATAAGAFLSLAGILLPWFFYEPSRSVMWTALLLLVLAYDFGPRAIPFGPVLMGLARGLDVMAFMCASEGGTSAAPVASFFLYTCLLSFLARFEGRNDNAFITLGRVTVPLSQVPVFLFTHCEPGGLAVIAGFTAYCSIKAFRIREAGGARAYTGLLLKGFFLVALAWNIGFGKNTEAIELGAIFLVFHLLNKGMRDISLS